MFHPDRKYLHLDFVRSVAVLLVFFGHLAHTLGRERGVGGAAHFGVVIFFVHTSLVLFMSMDRLGSQQHFLLRFYVRRLARIYPLSILATLIAFVFHIPPAPWIPFSVPGLRALTTNLLLVQNITGDESILSPMWSLPFEVQMYLVLPLPYVLLVRRGIPAPTQWITAALLCAGLQLLPWSGPAAIAAYAPCFCGGIVAYSRLHESKKTLSFHVLAFAMILTLVAAVAALQILPRSIADPLAALAVALIIGHEAVAIPVSVAVVSEKVAKYSYGLYLAHMPIMWLCFGDGRHGPVRWVSFAVLCVAVPFALYHVVEKPFIQLGARAFSAAQH